MEKAKKEKKKRQVPDPEVHEPSFRRCPYCSMLLPRDEVKVCFWCNETMDGVDEKY